MVRHRCLTFVLFAAALNSAPGLAQIGNVQEGARVRVRTGAGETAAGILLKSPTDSLFINVSTDASYPYVEKFALRKVTGVDLSVAQRGHAAEGLLIGGLAGAGIGYLFAAVIRDDEPSRNFGEAFGDAVGDAVVGGTAVIAFGLGGAIMGAIIGGGQKTDTWRPIDMTVQMPQLALRRMPGGRTGVGLSFAFGGAVGR